MNRENISDALELLDDELINSAASFREHKKAHRFSMVKAAAAAIAAALVISVSVISVGALYTFEVSELEAEKAMLKAASYACTSLDEHDEWDLFAYCFDDYHYDTSVVGKMSGLRPVYNVRFKVAGYAFDIDVDKKTNLVTRCDKEPDPDWPNRFDDYEEFEKQHINWLIAIGEREPEVTVGDINGTMASTIWCDYFDISPTHEFAPIEHGYVSVPPGVSGMADYTTDPMTFHVEYEHCGYIYYCRVNSVTGEVTEPRVEEVPDEKLKYPREKHLHEHPENSEYISRYQANFIALEELGLSTDYWDVWPDLMLDRTVVLDGELYDVPEDIEAYYRVFIREPFTGNEEIGSSFELTVVYVDAVTGKVFAVGKNGMSWHIVSQTPSAEAPEGMLSEADIMLLIVDDLGVIVERRHINDLPLKGFSIELVDGVYEACAAVPNGNPNDPYDIYDYRIDAVTGEILSKTQR